MDKKTALQTLIQGSSLRSEDKTHLLARIEKMTEAEMDELGTALANQKKQEVESAEKAATALAAMLATEPNP